MPVTFKDNSGAVLGEFAKRKSAALEAVGLRAETHAKEQTPVDTGRLRNSISHTVIDDSAYIGTNVEYAPYIELGTRKIKAHHMLKRAATEHGNEYRSIVRAVFGK